MNDAGSFGAWLTRERERRAITLRTISDRTKIGIGLLEALERGDVSRWPGGIYRRSFIRGYADVVGLDGDLVIANFERVFPDPEAPRPAEPVAPPAPPAPVAPPVRASDDDGEMRLLLAAPPIATPSWTTAAYEIVFPIAFGLLGLAAAGAIGFWCATAVAAIVYRLSATVGMLTQRPAQRATVSARPAKVAAVLHFSDKTARVGKALRARAASVAGDLVKEA